MSLLKIHWWIQSNPYIQIEKNNATFGLVVFLEKKENRYIHISQPHSIILTRMYKEAAILDLSSLKDRTLEDFKIESSYYKTKSIIERFQGDDVDTKQAKNNLTPSEGALQLSIAPDTTHIGMSACACLLRFNRYPGK